MGRGSLVGTLLLTLLAAAALPAQRRQPLVGSVVDGDGKPVAAAEVTLIEDDADLVGLDPIDVCRVVTDERGRFVASALVGVRYLALATTQERDGAAVVAQPVPDNSCGQIASLKIDLPAHRRHIAMPLAAELRALPGVHGRWWCRSRPAPPRRVARSNRGSPASARGSTRWNTCSWSRAPTPSCRAATTWSSAPTAATNCRSCRWRRRRFACSCRRSRDAAC